MPETDTAHGPKTKPSNKPSKQIHHGRTWAAWVGSILALVATVIGGIGVMMQNWPVFWVGVALLLVALIATKVLQAMGYGAD